MMIFPNSLKKEVKENKNILVDWNVNVPKSKV
jgi:hypothetical protein